MESPLILASSSKYKRRLLARLPTEFGVRTPGIDESRHAGESPAQMARRLAVEKARVIHEQESDALVLGSDQVAAKDDRIFGKPGSQDRAVEQLQKLQGATHQLITAVALADPDGGVETATAVYEMVMRRLTTDEIRAYVDEDRPVDCAGAYKIEAAGIRLFEATKGDDPTAIEGLPLTKVWGLLLDAGVEVVG